jgi:hypothetical protein
MNIKNKLKSLRIILWGDDSISNEEMEKILDVNQDNNPQIDDNQELESSINDSLYGQMYINDNHTPYMGTEEGALNSNETSVSLNANSSEQLKTSDENNVDSIIDDIIDGVVQEFNIGCTKFSDDISPKPIISEINLSHPSTNNAQTFENKGSNLATSNHIGEESTNIVNQDHDSAVCTTETWLNVLINRAIELINELDIISNKIESNDSKEIVSFCQNRLIECLEITGLEYINNEVLFDNSRHTPIPFSIVPNGTSIKRTIRKGIIYNGKTILKAQVEL